MIENGERATTLLEQIKPFLNAVPEKGELLLLNPPPLDREYSVFLMNGFNIFDNGLHFFNQVARRNDFTTRILDIQDVGLEKGLIEGNSLGLEFVKNEVHVYRHHSSLNESSS